MPKLIISHADGSLTQYEIGNEAVIVGSDPSAQISVQGTGVAPRHVQITPDGNGGYLVCDLGESDGTLINRHPIETQTHYQLVTQTRIQLGVLEAVFLEDEVQEEAPSAKSPASARSSTNATPVTKSGPAFPLLKPKREILASIAYLIASLSLLISLALTAKTLGLIAF
jgi:pSer/pThr/pTyr-binding forkhead associated (FHA) protein